MNPSPTPLPRADDVVAYWRDAGPSRWFKKDAAFDADFKARFESAHVAAADGRLSTWSADAIGALALLILLDQFPRNAYRGSARMFATDAQALQVARDALAAGFDQQSALPLRNFFYLPLMHSEDLADQDRCVALTEATDADTLRFARLHRDIVQRYGRFPHRNALLGRSTSPQEQRFLDEGGFAG